LVEEDPEVEAQKRMIKEMLEQRERERDLAEAAAKEEKRRQEMKKFLKKEHGKQAFAHLAHEGALDRQVWDRPDDELKRLGFLDEFHVASGGGGASAAENVHRLEEAVRAHVRSPSPAPRDGGGRLLMPPSRPGASNSRPTSARSATGDPGAGRSPRPGSKSTPHLLLNGQPTSVPFASEYGARLGEKPGTPTHGRSGLGSKPGTPTHGRGSLGSMSPNLGSSKSQSALSNAAGGASPTLNRSSTLGQAGRFMVEAPPSRGRSRG